VDWQSITAIAAALLAGIALLDKRLDKSLSIREHEEFRNNIKDQFILLGHRLERETDDLKDRIKTIEQTRPTTGEIAASLQHRNRTPPTGGK